MNCYEFIISYSLIKKNMKEYKILKDGKLWSDRFNSEEDAIFDMNQDMEEYPESSFEVQVMTDDEVARYEA